MGTNSMEDYAWIDEVAGESDGELQWTLDGFADLLPAPGLPIESSDGDLSGPLQTGRRKRAREAPLTEPSSKACREKLRRDKLNDRFEELSAVLDPGRPPRSDKASILNDAARVLEQLRREARQLKESNERLQDAIKDLKAEKNELRDEKLRLKADKEKLERQIRAQDPAPAKTTTTPYLLYPGVPPWPWLPRPAVDTSQDTRLWPPNA